MVLFFFFCFDAYGKREVNLKGQAAHDYYSRNRNMWHPHIPDENLYLNSDLLIG